MRHPRRMLLIFFMLCLFLAACGTGQTTSSNVPVTPTTQPVTLNVFAASSLTESFNEIKTKYHSLHPNVTITYQFAGSQALVQQLTNGASADIFASADQANMKKASDASLVTNSQIFAKNRLVVIVPANNPGNVQSLQDLARKGLKIVVAAPSVPVGKYGLQVLDKLGQSPQYGQTFENAVKADFVSQEDNVKAVLQKVQLGEADAGIVYQTDVTPAMTSKVKVITIPDQFNVIAEYPIAVLKGSAHTTEAQNFVQYIQSKDGQAVLAKYHFISVNNSGS